MGGFVNDALLDDLEKQRHSLMDACGMPISNERRLAIPQHCGTVLV